MFVPFCLTLLWVLALAFRVLSNIWQRPWKNWWWTLILGGTLILMPLMFVLDFARQNSRPHSVADWLFIASSILVPACCWIGVSTHVYNIHKKRDLAARPRVVDYVIDICLYPVILSILASHAFLALRMRGDSLDAGTTLAASGIFESWALASVLALFESYASISLWMKIGAYQFLVLNALVNVAEFFIKGVAPCKLCYRVGATSCVSLAKWFEHARYSEICQHVHQSTCRIPGWLDHVGIPEPEMLPIALGLSGTIAVCIVASLEHDRGAALSKGFVKSVDSQKTWLLSTFLTPRASFLKLLGVKLIVGVIFLQPYVLEFVRRSIPEINVEIANAWMLTIEAFLLHLFHTHAAYPAADFAIGGALARPELDFPGQAPPTTQYGAAPVGNPADGEHNDDGHNSSRLSWMEILIMVLLSLFVLSSWMSLSSMVNMGSCKGSVEHGFMGSGGVFHTCDTAAISCNGGFEFAGKSSNRQISAQCGQDERWFLTDSRTLQPLLGCTSCASGHVGYPDCIACSNEKHCNGHAHTIMDDGKREKCLCTCDGRWTGVECGLCAPGHISYPSCLACTVDGHCNGHAISVTDDGNRTSCKCTCDDRYSGPDCGTCSPGHILYPECASCSSAQHCNGHAVSVVEDGSRTSCRCTCDSRYGGTDCSSCSPGHINYPECTPCTNKEHCHGHAVNVTDDGTRSQCMCTCSKDFAGKHCSGFITQEHCTCKEEWETCSLGFLGCTTHHGCDKAIRWFGRSWCRTENGCVDSWDYC